MFSVASGMKVTQTHKKNQLEHNKAHLVLIIDISILTRKLKGGIWETLVFKVN